MFLSKRAVSRTVVAAVIIIVIIAAVGGVYYYTTLPTSTPTGKTLTVVQTAAQWFTQAGWGADPTWSTPYIPYLHLMYETLFSFDPYYLQETGGSIKLIPWLAESSTMSEDGLIHTIKLRKGVTFHITNHEMKAEDVKYSLDRYLFGEWPLDIVRTVPNVFTLSVESVEVVDDYTVQLNMKFRDPTILDQLSSPWFSIMEKSEVEAHAEIGEKGLSDHGYLWLNDETGEAGTGPYKIKYIKLGERYEIEKCDNYWGGPPDLDLPEVKIDEIIFLGLKEESDARMKLERGEIDLLLDVTPEGWNAYTDKPGFTAYLGPSTGWMRLYIHCVTGPLRDWKVRKAVKLSIDYEALVEEVMLGGAVVSQGAFSPPMPGWEKTADYIMRDVETAKALLDEAGYPDPGEPGAEGGWRFKLDIYARPGSRYGMTFVDIALVLKANLAEVGIDVVVHVYEVGEFYSKFRGISGVPPYEGMWITIALSVSPVEPYRVLQDCLMETNCDTWFGFNETTTEGQMFDSLTFLDLREKYIACMNELDPAKRLEMWQELDALTLEYGPGIGVVGMGDRVIYSNKILNFVTNQPLMLWPGIFLMDIAP